MSDKQQTKPKASMNTDTVKIIKRLFGFILSGYKLQCIFVVACILVSTLAMARGTLFMQALIDDYIMPLIGTDKPNYVSLAAALAQIAIIYIIGALCSWAYNRLMVNVSQGTLLRFRKAMFEHMEKLPIKYFDTHAHGDTMSIYTNDTDTLRQMIGQSLPQCISSMLTIVTVFICMVSLSIPLTVVTVLLVIVMMLISKNLVGRSGVYFARQQKALGTLNGYIEEMMEGQKVVKVFCHENDSLKDFRKLNEELCDSSDKANALANILMPVAFNIGNISYVLCAIVGGIIAINGWTGLTVGTLVSFLTFNKSFNQPIAQVSQQLNSVVMALAGAERIFNLLDETPETDNGYVTLVNVEKIPGGILKESDKRTGIWAWKHIHQKDGSVTYTELKGDIVFDNVDFGYSDDKIVLHNINLFATPGQKIAFVGSTGAGKTTITNLINRFYDIQVGKIRYDGININKIKKSALRHSLGIVLQDTQLFTGTVMDNIRFGKLDATDGECIAAAKLANADGFIRRLPDGYNTVLRSNGSNLSQGQRQLIAIARAAVADPPVLILDEATSSIDTRTETFVQAGMDKLMKGRTTFVIAHRLSTVKNSDCIMVLENGRIIERGSHDELVKAKGKYYQLYTGNFEESA